MSERQEIEEIADLASILPNYHDQTGRLVDSAFEARRSVVEGMGFAVGTAAERKDTLDQLRRRRDVVVPRIVVVDAGAPASVPLRRPDTQRIGWTVLAEDGATSDGMVKSRSNELTLPALPAGYHRLVVRCGSEEFESLVVSAPAKCWRPRVLEEGRSEFGITAQSYSLRSSRQFGIGDFTDVGDLAVGAARWGASFLGLSPAHALFPTDPARHSPYSPSSRLFLQIMMIDPGDMGAGASAAAARLVENERLAACRAALRSNALLDYPRIWAFKRELFNSLEDVFDDADRSEFESFRRERGVSLEQHALFETLSERFAADGVFSSDCWPSAFRSLESADVARFREADADRILFHARLQFVADRQFEKAQRRARDAGMTIGLYRDLAVGADRSGSELWSSPSDYLTAMSVGAPPDPLGPQGQDWGLPPFDPFQLETKQLRPFRDLVVANMRHAGALRIDHAFQLRRLFLMPVGAGAERGAYVSYPLEALLGVLRVESHRAKCLVVAEDLGTAPRGFSDAIMRADIFSYRLLSFERDAAGAFIPPHAYPRNALASLGTHDLPTLRGWWRGLDIDLRECFGFFNPKLAEQERAMRAIDRERLTDALRRESLPAETASAETAPPIESCLRFLARAPSALAAIQIEDVAGETQQVNLPGPSQGYPNWRRRLSLDVDALTEPGGPLARVAATLAREKRGLDPAHRTLSRDPPMATYRLQLHKDFGFDAASAILPYLAALGVSHVYCSPITKAAAGSMHGYDVVDYLQINPELGGMPGFMRFSEALGAAGLELIIDFVPNHMGVAGSDNPWWSSVLEWGEESPFAQFFDIDFESERSPGRVLLPILGAPYADVLHRNELSVVFDTRLGAYFVTYFDRRLPLRPSCYPDLLTAACRLLGDEAGPLEACATQFEKLAAVAGERKLRVLNQCKADLQRAAEQTPVIRSAIEDSLSVLNSGTLDGRRALDDLLSRQAYRPAFWRLASRELNYRRFFDISTLAGIRAERPDVFARMHELIFDLARRGLIQGIRLDHVDGLADPAQYIEKLQSALGPGFYIVVEKILEAGEELRDWPIAGDTGYGVLAELDQLFVASDNVAFFDEFARATAGAFDVHAEQIAIKSRLLSEAFGGELQNLADELRERAQSAPYSLDLGEEQLREAISSLLVAFPVYRSYIDSRGPTDADRALFSRAAREASRRLRPEAHRALAFIIASLTTDTPDQTLLRTIIRFQQLTGPLMAKSAEDTLFYRYTRLIALNEVGGDPSQFGESADSFHASMSRRVSTWPAALTATATHDTKRGEDSRARLIAATSMPAIWRNAYETFDRARERAPHGPDDADCSYLFQALLAALPFELIESPHDRAARRDFSMRIGAFATKAMREAKRRTSWTDPDAAYENQVHEFLGRLLGDDDPFLSELAPFAAEIATAGAKMSLARTVLKCTMPGVPDFYQGGEFWDFSFVDPDNRRPVDYKTRADGLSSAFDFSAPMPRLQDQSVKQAVTARLLADRRTSPDLYAIGDYRPIPIVGADARRFIGFERRFGDRSLIVLVNLRFGSDVSTSNVDAAFDLPSGIWRNLLGGETLQGKASTSMERTFAAWPALALKKAN